MSGIPPGAGGVWLLNRHLLDPRLVDPVDDRVSQFTHQLKEEQMRRGSQFLIETPT